MSIFPQGHLESLLGEVPVQITCSVNKVNSLTVLNMALNSALVCIEP